MSGLSPSLPTGSFAPGSTPRGADAARDVRRSDRVTAQPQHLAWPRRLNRVLVLTDLLAVAVSLVVAQIVRFGTPDVRGGSIDTLYLGVAVAIAVLWMLCLAA
ncbi:hypothetical protein FJ656_29675, partial [Schumannella luteola]